MDAGDRQFEAFFEAASQPAFVLVILAFVLLLTVTALFTRLRWVWLTCLLYLSTLGSEVSLPWFKNRLAFPLQELREIGRPLCFAMLLLLMVPTLMAGKGWRARFILPGAGAYFAFQVIYCAPALIGGIWSRGVIGPVIFLFAFATLGLGVSRWIQESRHAYMAARCLVVAAMLMMAGTCFQLVMNSDAIVLNGRLFGVTNNPNTLGYISAISIPTFCLLLVGRREGKAFEVVLVAGLGLNIAFLLWCTSRGAMVATLVALTIFFRRRMGPLLLVSCVSAIAVLVVLQIFDISAPWSRLTTFEDTRSVAWMSMIRRFLSSPVVGDVSGQLVIEENLYLAVPATAGLLGTIPFLFALMRVGVGLRRLGRSSQRAADDAVLVDYVLAIVLSMLVGNLFDAHLLGTFVYSVFTFYIVMSIGSYLAERAALEAPLEYETEHLEYTNLVYGPQPASE